MVTPTQVHKALWAIGTMRLEAKDPEPYERVIDALCEAEVITPEVRRMALLRGTS